MLQRLVYQSRPFDPTPFPPQSLSFDLLCVLASPTTRGSQSHPVCHVSMYTSSSFGFGLQSPAPSFWPFVISEAYHCTCYLSSQRHFTTVHFVAQRPSLVWFYAPRLFLVNASFVPLYLLPSVYFVHLVAHRPSLVCSFSPSLFLVKASFFPSICLLCPFGSGP